MSMMGLGSGRELASLIRTHAEAAIAVDDASLFGHALLGFVAATHDYDWIEADRHFNRAVASPNTPGIVLYLYSLLYLAPLGHAEAGIQEIEKAIERDPLNVVLRTGLAGQLFLAGMYDRCARGERRRVGDRRSALDGQFWCGRLVPARGIVRRDRRI